AWRTVRIEINVEIAAALSGRNNPQHHSSVANDWLELDLDVPNDLSLQALAQRAEPVERQPNLVIGRHSPPPSDKLVRSKSPVSLWLPSGDCRSAKKRMQDTCQP